jgi:hypothetical protein
MSTILIGLLVVLIPAVLVAAVAGVVAIVRYLWDTGESVRVIVNDDEYCTRCGDVAYHIGYGQFKCSEGHIS